MWYNRLNEYLLTEGCENDHYLKKVEMKDLGKAKICLKLEIEYK